MALCGFLCWLGGCTDKSDTDKSPFTPEQQALLKDPFKPTTTESYDISGGDIGNLDKKALKRDIDNVLNP